MAAPYFPHRPLRLHPGYVHGQLALFLALGVPGALGAAGLFASFVRHGPSALAPLFVLSLLFGAVSTVVVGLRLRGQQAACRDGIELHLPITERRELAPNGRPSGKITFSFLVPSAPGGRARPQMLGVT